MLLTRFLTVLSLMYRMSAICLLVSVSTSSANTSRSLLDSGSSGGDSSSPSGAASASWGDCPSAASAVRLSTTRPASAGSSSVSPLAAALTALSSSSGPPFFSRKPRAPASMEKDNFCNLVQMGARLSADGDSGGPVYWGSTAYGLHQGWMWDPVWPFTRDVFSRADRIDDALGYVYIATE